MAAAKKFVVVVDHLVGFNEGDEATEKGLEGHGGTVAHLLKIGAIRAKNKETEG